MADWQLTTPVAFLIFNRPDTTARVFAEIARARPPKLLVVADGPRPDQPGEAEKCAAARAIVEQGISWPCEVLTNYSEINLGCKQRVSSGLDWVFNTVEEAIILEDDCLPHPTFFHFCGELLEKYRDDKRIMAVSGDNFQYGQKRTDDSYYFSRYNHIWGWASWRRAWQCYDIEMKLWSQVRDGGWLNDLLLDSTAVRYWAQIFQAAYEGRVQTWDYQWLFTCWMQNGLTALPNTNLVSNIGFGLEATHTSGRSPFACIPVEPMSFPLKHPPFIIRDARADQFTQKVHYGTSLVSYIFRRTKRIASKLARLYL